jgi:small conductance mechanosensitive channel
MLFTLLQTQTIPPEIIEKASKISVDTLAIKSVQLIESIKEGPTEKVVSSLTQSAITFGLKVLAALVIYVVGAWVISLVRKLLKRYFQRRKTEPTLASFLYSLITISMWVLLVVLTVSALGVNTTSLAALLAAGGMAIGMALSGTVQNFAGGLMLLIFKPFKVGDFIEAQGFSGFVKEVNIVSTKLKTTDNRLVVIPNGALSNGNITNITAHPLRRVDLKVCLSYGTDAAKAKEALLAIVASNPLFLNAESEGAQDPLVAVQLLDNSSVNFIVRAWVQAQDYWEAYFWLNEQVYTQLPEKYGLSFPFPQLDVHVKQD